MNIVIIGYRGTGKTVVGKLLSRQLGIPYMGMDANIEKRAGMPIPEIVARDGWSRFRDLESEEARNLAAQDNIIIDTGGGIIERPENMDFLKSYARVFWLKASVDTIVSRIQEGTQRPALTDGKTFTEEVEEVLTERIPKYKTAADYEIDTDQLTSEQVADCIVDIWKGRQL